MTAKPNTPTVYVNRDGERRFAVVLHGDPKNPNRAVLRVRRRKGIVAEMTGGEWKEVEK